MVPFSPLRLAEKADLAGFFVWTFGCFKYLRNDALYFWTTKIALKILPLMVENKR
ncbi:hypothetical protein HMPREF0539_1076 [Lacticaseibacillus rhamnosus LMS2-1]|uniref:Uncharacterized protein n=1 Tax=Lacticaseibacillus rhamnosus (strain LMS2-1) TaxID=525361 RepID=C2JVZ2_LACRM|nr:hypothetical protein HMPREF0539_1076 [Lacticaseibacillus rhamnosus LMS2-1]